MRFKYKDKVQVTDEFYGNPTGTVRGWHNTPPYDGVPEGPIVWEVRLDLNDGTPVYQHYSGEHLKEITNESQS